jgi:hypothetical protein
MPSSRRASPSGARKKTMHKLRDAYFETKMKRTHYRQRTTSYVLAMVEVSMINKAVRLGSKS